MTLNIRLPKMCKWNCFIWPYGGTMNRFYIFTIFKLDFGVWTFSNLLSLNKSILLPCVSIFLILISSYVLLCYGFVCFTNLFVSLSHGRLILNIALQQWQIPPYVSNWFHLFINRITHSKLNVFLKL